MPKMAHSTANATTTTPATTPAAYTLNSFPSPTRMHMRYTRYYAKDKPATLHENRPISTISDDTNNTAISSSTDTSPQRLRHSHSRSDLSFTSATPTVRRSLNVRPSLGSRRSQSSPTGTDLLFSSTTSYSPASSISPDRHSPVKFRRRLNSLSVMLEASSGGLQRSMSYGAVALGGSNSNGPTGGPQSAQAVYQTIVETVGKRISTLDYLRKSHEGRVYWFNTLLYTKPELLRLAYFSPQKLARRAQNYLLLGFSLPMILDLNSQTPNEYLKALGALMAEFEQYQSMHPPDGTSSSLSRARIPSMFKRATGTSTKSRRITDASISTLGGGSDPSVAAGTPGAAGASLATAGMGLAGSADHGLTAAAMPPPVPSLPVASSAEPLLPTEQYTHLLTPPLPFDPDFFEVFATLCDVLIDCYSRVTYLITSPEMCGPGSGLGDLFQKVDARIRKVLVNHVVREFEEQSRNGVKGEIAGVGKVILGGLM